MKHIERIRRLAGLQEARQVSDPDEEDRLDAERSARENKISLLIQRTFQRIGIAIADDGVFYDETSNREVTVTLDDTEIDLDLLLRLKPTGLAVTYQISWSSHALSVVFQVNPDLDHAVLKPAPII